MIGRASADIVASTNRNLNAFKFFQDAPQNASRKLYDSPTSTVLPVRPPASTYLIGSTPCIRVPRCVVIPDGFEFSYASAFNQNVGLVLLHKNGLIIVFTHN